MLGFQRRRCRLRLDERSDTLGQGEQVVCDAPRDLHPSHRELDSANKLGRCFKAGRHSRAQALMYRGLDIGAALSGENEGAADEGGGSWNHWASRPNAVGNGTSTGVGIRAGQRELLLLWQLSKMR